MKRQTRILAGTAIGLLMASTPLFAAPKMNLVRPQQAADAAPLVLAQAQQDDDEKERKRKKGEKAGKKGADAEQAKPKSQAEPDKQAQPKAEAAPKPEAKPEKQAAQPKPEKQAAQPEPKAKPEPAQKAAEPKPEKQAAQPEPKVKPEPAQKAAEPKPEKQAAQPEPKVKPEPAQKAAEPKAVEKAKPQRPAAASEPEPAKQASEPKPAKEAAEPKPAQQAVEPETQKPSKAQNDNQKQPATAEGRKEKLRDYLKKKGQNGETAAEQPKAQEPKAAEQPKAGESEQTAKPDEQQQPANQNQQAEDGQKPTETVLPGNLKGGKQRRQERVKEQADAQPLPDNAAPVFDSNKRGPRGDDGRKGEARNDRQERKQEEAKGDAPPPPKSDSAAQKVKLGADIIRSLLTGDTEGERFEADSREARREFRRRRHQHRDNADVVKEYDDNRTIIEINNRIYIDNTDSDRIIRRNDRVYYEELRRGRTREVVVRRNGARVVTIRNRYGDIIRRSRIMPDGREVVLVYVPDDELRHDQRWYDPARDLPPLRLTVPVSSYILEAASVEQPDRYYEFLEQPPVAPIERIYSVEDVKRSARVRDTMPRIDLDTINFATGSAEIAESEVDELDGIAQAILKVLNDNPGETFLIEGHTDAVGSEESNLVLSDRRAEAVANALTSVYDIPPENLVTQGYGEEYLKIDTGDAERANRRVAMRRITPLVAPVASAE